MQRTVKNPLHALIKSKGVTAVAREMGVSQTTMYTWINRGYVPVGKITQFANVMNISMYDAISFAERKQKVATRPTLRKPKETLETLLEVKKGNLGIDEAAAELGLSEHALSVTYTRNEHRLELLHETLTAFYSGEITVQKASENLDVSIPEVYHLMRTYGLTKERQKATEKPVGRYTKAKPTYEKLALDAIVGRTNVKKAAEQYQVSQRTLHRYVVRLIEPFSLTEIAHWPRSFRQSLALERQGKGPEFIGKLLNFVREHHILLKKKVETPEEVFDWREATPVRMLVAVLYGEFSLREIAIMRKGSEQPIKDLMSAQLLRFGVTFNDVATFPVAYQTAIADLLIMKSSRERHMETLHQ